jgi:adenylosuccinate lyase
MSFSSAYGRYSKALSLFPNVEEEYTLSRVRIEVEHFLRMCRHFKISVDESVVRNFVESLGSQSCRRISQIEAETNHDVVAIVKYITESLRLLGVSEKALGMVHFGLTSQDVNSFGFVSVFSKCLYAVREKCDLLIEELFALMSTCEGIPMLTFTHGQPAVPSTLDKELAVYYYRLQVAMKHFIETSYTLTVKFGGVNGNHNALYLVDPGTDWHNYSKELVEFFGFKRSPVTSQIDNYLSVSRMMSEMVNITLIVEDLSRNVHAYIQKGYFKQLVKSAEAGSSAMPNKVNPIGLEQSWGQFSMARSQLHGFIETLQLSLMQRDLHDSTVTRFVPEALAKVAIGLVAVTDGLSRLTPDSEQIRADLNNHSEVLAEACQTLLRFEGQSDAYEEFKKKTRGQVLTHTQMQALLPVSIPTVQEYVGKPPNYHDIELYTQMKM